MIGIVNYKVGNLQNLQNSLDFIGADSILVNEPHELEKVEKIIFPGVGAFGHAAKSLVDCGFWEPMKEKVAQRTPILGICVGMQLLFSESFEDGRHEGLGLIKGAVKRFSHDLKIPQIGWNKVFFSDSQNPLVDGINEGAWFYFVHSYACFPDESSRQLGTTEYGESFCSIVHDDHLWGVQFHPEKSQDDGLRLLRNFVEKC